MKTLGLRNMKRARSINVQADQLVTYGTLKEGQPVPCLVQPKVQGIDIVSWAGGHKSEIEDKLATHGGLLFRGFDVSDPGILEKLIIVISGELLTYKERSSPRVAVAGNIYTSTEHPQDQHIFLHNENSYQKIWPMKLFFMCAIAPQARGETPIADCRNILQNIDPEVIARFEEKRFQIVRNYHFGIGLPWTTVFGTQDRDEVDAYCADHDIQTKWKRDGSLRTITIRNATAHHPKSGEKVWFNHGTFFHVTTLEPELATRLQQQLAPEDLPTNTFYGDGTPIEADVLDHIRQVYQEETILFPWQKGDVLLLDNMLCAHGRSPFEGERRILVAMAEAMSAAQLPKH